MQNLTPSTPAPQQPSTATITTEQKAERLRILLRRSFMLSDDESIERLTWSDRDQIARDLHEAMCLLHELHPHGQTH